jgi:hypothetical protein
MRFVLTQSPEPGATSKSQYGKITKTTKVSISDDLRTSGSNRPSLQNGHFFCLCDLCDLYVLW